MSLPQEQLVIWKRKEWLLLGVEVHSWCKTIENKRTKE